MRALIIGGILQAAAIAAYATLAFSGASIPLFALVMAGDNFGISFAGVAVENLSATHGLIHAYGIFFIVCGLTGVPAVLLFAALGYWHRQKQPASATA